MITHANLHKFSETEQGGFPLISVIMLSPHHALTLSLSVDN